MQDNSTTSGGFGYPVSILMPVRNEIKLIESVLREWNETVLSKLPDESEIIFDDGFSKDGTFEYLTEQAKISPQIKVIRGETLDGFANAARRLYLAAKNEWVFFTDADGQYVPSEFWKLTPYAASFDMVHGVKTNRKDPLYRKAASFVFNLAVRDLLTIPHKDVNSAFRLVRRDLIVEILPKVHCMPTLINAEILLRLVKKGAKVKDIDVEHRSRLIGRSRGLPPLRFAQESFRAWRGLRELQRELQ